MSDASPTAADRAALLKNSSALAERLGVARLDVVVVEVADLGRSMRRIVIGGPGLAEIEPRPGQDLLLSVATAGGATVRRRYTIRRHDAVAATVAMDIVLHGDGPGARWAANARIGDQVEVLGPRGVIGIEPDADWHLFVGDESFFPAMSAMAEALPDEKPATVICEADEPAALPPLAPSASRDVQLMTRVGAPGDAAALLAAAADVHLLEGRGHAYLGGELHVVNALKRALFERGLDESQVSAKAYWRAGAANANHGEPER